MRWFTSDLHAGHLRICEFEPIRPKDFLALYFRNWIEKVAPADTVYFLGDLVFNTKEFRTRFAEDFAKLPGHKIMVRGNHDERFTDEYFASCGFEEIHPVDLWLPDRQWLLSHYPITNEDPRRFQQVTFIQAEYRDRGAVANIHGHTHSHHSSDPRCVNVALETTGMSPISEDVVAELVEYRRLNGKDKRDVVFDPAC